MKTLYKNSRLIAAVIVGALVLSAGTAVAITKDSTNCKACQDNHARAKVEDMGRFEVTPNSMKFVAPGSVAGRFNATQRQAAVNPRSEKATT